MIYIRHDVFCVFNFVKNVYFRLSHLRCRLDKPKKQGRSEGLKQAFIATPLFPMKRKNRTFAG